MTTPARSTPPGGSLRGSLQRILFPSPRPPKNSVRSLVAYGAKGVISLGATTALFLDGFIRPGSRARLNAFLGQLGIVPPRPMASLPKVSLDGLPGTNEPIRILEPVASDGNVTLLELMVIAKVVATVKPRVVLEIGTFDGRTTLNLAANAPGTVLTLDLPPDKLGSTELPIDPSDASYIEKPVSGARFLNRPERTRITQLYGDSATFDFTPWLGGVDLVFIDGAHSREYVLNDTDRALRLLRPEGGVVLWHDYDAAFDGVTVALDEIRARGVPVRHVEGTTLAIAFVDGSHRNSR